MSVPSEYHSIVPRDATVRLVQLTDTHLCEERGGTLLGMDTDHSLQAVIDLVQRERPTIDLVLGTGDISDQGAAPSYERAVDYFSQFDCDSFWLPGNHDSVSLMAGKAAMMAGRVRELRLGDWQIVLLNSQVPGQVGGTLGEQELADLRERLSAAAKASLHTLVCLHHQPVPIGCAWLDEQMVSDAAAFFDILDEFPQVRGVLWGHVHQEFDSQRGPVRLLGSPSTCVQFAPGSERFKADDQPPGYRWLNLHADGTIETAVSRVWNVPFQVELDSGGYL